MPGAIFIHASGFIGGHKTKEGALEMAIKVRVCVRACVMVDWRVGGDACVDGLVGA